VKVQRNGTTAIELQVEAVMAELRRRAVPRIRDEMEPRYGIRVKKALGVGMAQMQEVAAQFGRSHELAAALWKREEYEAKTVAIYVEEPERVTAAQLERWAKDFDNWAIVDTACFKLFDQLPFALEVAEKWTHRSEEFVKRAGYALIACVALHDKSRGDADFRRLLPRVAAGLQDGRNFVDKGAFWAVKAIARRSKSLATACAALMKKTKAAKAGTRKKAAKRR
jgi:3-methyladenine DNA glycosylase AlkD